MYKFSILVILCVFLSIFLNGVLCFQGFRKVCTDTTPQCLRETVQAALPDFIQGIPQLGINSLDPFVVKSLNLTLPGGLNVEFTNGYAKGLKNCIIESMTKSGDTYELIYKCNFVIKGKYHYSGDILYFNLHGAGDTIITSKNVVTKWTFQLGTINKDGKEYFQMKNFNSSINYEGRVHYYMTNLIPGNPEMSQTILTYMNQNWRNIAQEFGGPVFKYGVETILHNVYKLFDSVPKDNIIQP